ncbi:zinc finger protein 57-like [Plodia interpunctella]|uniref:zinc finger protein 57-like n=1 Tax=Plodia interpunctella TaxID=58824 RepID=UPI0023681267|nr:zinc finger protein 57-like [Plodia interpunctella]
MNEIDINIEGFNVNGICVGCLNYKRRMYNDIRINDCFKVLAKIEVPECLSIQVCWECLAAVRTVDRFQKQIVSSFEILHDYSRKHMFLDNPSDLSRHAQTRFSISPIQIEPNCEPLPDKAEVKEEPHQMEIEIDESIAIKTEDDDDSTQAEDLPIDDASIDNNSIDNMEEVKSDDDDDVSLSKLKKKKKKKKSRDETKEKTKNKKLKTLPEDLVEIYTVPTEKGMRCIREDDLNSAEFQAIKYKCQDCVMGFLSLKLVNAHMEGRHQPKGDTSCQCDVCKAYFLSKDNLVSHRLLHFTAYRCKKCDFKTSAKRIISQHILRHDEAVHKCSECGAGFSSRSRLNYHKSVCSRERPQCDCCGKVFANKMTLKYHLKANKLIASNKEEKPKEKLYIPCKGCDKVFPSKKSYKAHSAIHEGLTYPCQICGKLFQWKRNLARHTRNHREKEAGALHECRECGKSFSSRDCYNNHMKLSKRHAHPDAYIHQCSFCGKKFATKWCMVDHVDWEHLKNIRYRCNVCYKPFKTAKILVAHVKNIHEGAKQEVEGEHLCEICGKSYKTEKRLKGHVWAMHTRRSTAKTFKCKLCPATFTWQTSIYKHMKMMHDSNKRNKPSRSIPLKKEDHNPEIDLANRMQFYQQNLNGIHSVPISF